ncbi:MAG: Hpt domain-containing protein [Acetatifactor sp.]
MLEDSTREKILEAGVDVDSALNRFMGKDDLLIRFLKKLTQDKNCELFRDSMNKGNYEEAFAASHTLKGVCGNLSLTTLYDILCKEVELLRNQEYDRAQEMSTQVVEEYARVMTILNTL